MVKYTCYECSKKVGDEFTRKRVRCPYCGSKVLYKQRTAVTKVKAR